MRFKDMMKKYINEGVDNVALRKLELYINNDGQLYKDKKSYIKNLMTKIGQGKYDFNRSIDLWMFYIEKGAKKYAKEFSIGSDWSITFPKPLRRELARKFAKDFYDEMKEGEYNEYFPKKYQSMADELIKKA